MLNGPATQWSFADDVNVAINIVFGLSFFFLI